MKILDRFLVCLYVAFAALPFVAMKLRWSDHAIYGRLPPTPHPHLAFDAFRAEEYQKAYTAWFESKLGLKGYAMAADNTLLFHALGETKPDAPVIVGKRGVLFLNEDINHFNKDGYWIPDDARVNKFADQIAALQTRLHADHKALVPVISPAKTSIYRDDIPASRTRDLGEPRPSDTRIYGALVKALDARGVRYVDARALLTADPAARDVMWGTYARHWSHYASCIVMREVAHAYSALADQPLPYDCTLAREPATLADSDYDLLGLLNIWGQPSTPDTVPVGAHSPAAPSAARPSVMFVGTSFCWNILRDADRSGVFGSIHLDYYDKTLIPWPDGEHVPVAPGTDAWRGAFLHDDLYVLDLFEGYILAPGDSYADTFLAAMLLPDGVSPVAKPAEMKPTDHDLR